MILAGCVVSIAGSIVCLLAPDNFVVMLAGQTLKGLSSVPGAYIMMALFADVLDHLEAKLGYRVDGISMSVYNTVLTVVNGLAVAVFNFSMTAPCFPIKEQLHSFPWIRDRGTWNPDYRSILLECGEEYQGRAGADRQEKGTDIETV